MNKVQTLISIRVTRLEGSSRMKKKFFSDNEILVVIINILVTIQTRHLAMNVSKLPRSDEERFQKSSQPYSFFVYQETLKVMKFSYLRYFESFLGT